MNGTCAEPPTRETEIPGLIAGRRPELKFSVSKKICPSVIEITLVGTKAETSPACVSMMGSAVSEPVLPLTAPFVCFSTSGGARMQESMISLMQMAKTSAALQKLKAEKLPYISVMVDPIYGGVSASLAMLGDINIAEPDALVGFAGRRVIEQTVRVDLPDDFQKSEFLLKHGAIDMIVHRRNIRTKVHGLLKKIYKA